MDAGVELRKISAYVQCAPGTVTRWINGFTSPLPRTQKEIVKWLERRIKYFKRIKDSAKDIENAKHKKI
jgi:hypothetical protein